MVGCVCFTLSVILLSVCYIFCKRKFNYWTNKNVKAPGAWPIVGNFGSVMFQKESVNECVKNIHLNYKGDKLVGLYRGFQPMILVRDPVLIKHVLVKDFNYFPMRGMSAGNSRLSDNLFSAEGEKWRIMRKKLTPVFTTAKLKNMVPLMQKCVNNLMQYVDNLIRTNQDYEIRSLTSKYTIGVIGSCAFGLDINTFTDEDNEFSVMAKKIFTQSWTLRLINILDMIIPGIRKMFNTTTRIIEIQEFFVGLVREVLIERGGKTSNRKDFMDFMIDIREQGKIKTELDNEEDDIEIDDYMLAAQAFVFYAAGFETSSATMSFMIHELALSPDIQDRAYKDVVTAIDKHNGEINYDSIKDMKYLEMVFDETLRKYTAAGILFRKSTANYVFPGTGVAIPKGTPVLISVSALNVDSEYFPNPYKFDPENFLPVRINQLPQCVYMPFGDGPRNCIGMRLAKLQSMLGMAAFLKKFKFETSTKTTKKLSFSPKAMILTANEGIWVKILQR